MSVLRETALISVFERDCPERDCPDVCPERDCPDGLLLLLQEPGATVWLPPA